MDEEITKMLAGFEEMLVDMERVANVMRQAQLRHADALQNITDHPMPSAQDPQITAILDIVSAVASAQILTMEMAQCQMRISMKQLSGLIGDGEES